MAAHNNNTSGPALLNDFLAAYVALATVETARYEAEQSEASALDYLNHAGSGRFLHPGAIPEDSQTKITRASLDAHIKKVQAQQLAKYSRSELEEMQQHAQQLYRGLRVRVTNPSGRRDVIESVWYDKQRGYRTGIYLKASVSGIIDEVLLREGILVLRPRKHWRLLNPSLTGYYIHVIDPIKMAPRVHLQLI